MNLEQKVDAICKKVGIDPNTGADTPTTLQATIDPASLTPVTDQLTTIAQGVADIQSQIDEPPATGGQTAA